MAEYVADPAADTLLIPPGAVTGQLLADTVSGLAWLTQAQLATVAAHAPGTPAPGTSTQAARADHVHPDNELHYVTGFPSNAVGGDGASAIDTATGRLYGPKTAGGWPNTYFNLGARFDPTAIAGFVGRWTADDLALTDGDNVASWAGSNGHAFGPYAGTVASGYTIAPPHYTLDAETGLPVVRFDPGASKNLIQTLVLNAAQTFKHAFVVAKHTPATNEGDFEGLFTGPTSADVALTMRESDTTNTMDLQGAFLTAASYRLNGTGYAGGDIYTALAPRNAFGVISLSSPTSFSWVPQIGGDRNSPSRGWKGDIREVWLFANQLTGTTLTDVEQFLKARSLVA